MILSEPPQTQADLNFRCFGFPVRVTPMFWIAALLLGWTDGDPHGLVAWIVAVFTSILIHELGHAVAFRHYGVDCHVVLYHFGGLAVPTGYGHVAARRMNQIVVSAAGPAAQVLFAAALGGLLLVAGYGIPLGGFVGELLHLPYFPLPESQMVAMFLQQFMFVSVYWALLNLLPIYPLDGGQISRELFLKWDQRDPLKHSLMLSLFAAGAMAVKGFSDGRTYVGILFGMLAYSSYSALQAYQQGGGYRNRW